MKESRTVTNILLICLVLIMLSLATFGVAVARYNKKIKDHKEEIGAPFDIELWWDPGSTFLKEYVEQISQTEFVTIAKSDKEIVAPNTSGSMILRVKGCTKVPFRLTLNLEEMYSDNWKTAPDGETYHPIVLKATTDLRGPEISVTIQDDLLVDVGVFDANLQIDGQVKITWEWPYHTGDQDDDADTYMGSLGADATYGLKATAAATQVNY